MIALVAVACGSGEEAESELTTNATATTAPVTAAADASSITTEDPPRPRFYRRHFHHWSRVRSDLHSERKTVITATAE